MNFSKITKQQVNSPPLIVLYGGPGIGKTAFGIGASEKSEYKIGRDDHLLINIDYRGADRLACNRITDILEHEITSTKDISLIFKNLVEKNNPFKWIIFDDLTTLEELFVQEVCFENHVDNLQKIEYGRGYELARVKWYHLFDMIKEFQVEKSIGILLIGHTKVESFKDPLSDSYSKHDLQLDKRSREIIKKSVDLIGFAHKKTFTTTSDSSFGKKEIKAVGKSQRVITFSPDLEGFESKDRFNLPEEIPLDWDYFESELLKSINKTKVKKGE